MFLHKDSLGKVRLKQDVMSEALISKSRRQGRRSEGNSQWERLSKSGRQWDVVIMAFTGAKKGYIQGAGLIKS